MLDVGCGTKVVKALADDRWPVGRYVDIDVDADVISWLDEHVTDERFEFHHLDARNDRYNPSGVPLGDIGRLPAGDEPFDLICLFSVFTHLDPSDFVSMLRLVRPHLALDGRLVFSLFLTDPSDTWAKLVERSLASDDPQVIARAEATICEAIENPPPGFVDEVPEIPLMRARYDRHYARSLVDAGGSSHIEAIEPPTPYIQNYMICTPI